MAGDKVLVLGGTGPTGICLLRELVYRKQDAIVYARSPQKIPKDLAPSPHLEVIKGEMTDSKAISEAVSKCNVVLSLLGPNSRQISDPSLFADYYRHVFAAMREHGVKRIYAMGTFTRAEPRDQAAFLRWLFVWGIYLFYNVWYHNILNLCKAFEEDAADLDWTIYRIGAIIGANNHAGWMQQRQGEVAVGWVGESNWTSRIDRGELARWLVDAAERKTAHEWVRKMPAVSSKNGGGKIKES